MKKSMTSLLVVTVSIFAAAVGSASACPVAIGPAAPVAFAVQAVAAPVVVSAAPIVVPTAPIVVQYTPAVYLTAPVLTAPVLAAPTVSLSAVPLVIEHVVRIKSRRACRTPLRRRLFR